MSENQQVATRQPPKVVALLDQHMEQFAAALPATIPSERFIRVVKTALQRNPDLMRASPKSILLACEKAAADGLVLDGRDAALVMFKGEAQYIPMIGGIIKRAYNTGLVASIHVHLVYKRETEEIDPHTGRPRFMFIAGDDERIEHSPIVFGEKGPVVGAYAILRFKSGGVVRELMTIEEIERIARMQAKNVGDNGKLKGVWGQHFGEMAKKTVLRRLFKRQPMDSDLNRLFAEGDEPDDDFDQRDDEERSRDEGKARTGRGPKRTAAAASKLNDPEPIDAEYTEHDPETGEIHDDGPEGPDDYDQSPEPEQTRAAPQQARQQPRQAARPQSTRQQAKPAQRPAERDDDGFPAADGVDVF
jgi:recombination protein RecT